MHEQIFGFTTALNFRGELFDLFLKAADLRMEIIIFWVFLMGHSHATPVMRDALHPGEIRGQWR